MRNDAVIGRFERRLVESGFPGDQVRRNVRELAEHHQDLKQNALEEGLSEAEAQTRADELLGEPAVLAEILATALRQSSWWGRHPIIGFGLLPPLGILLLLSLGLGLDCLLGALYFPREQLTALANSAPGLNFFRVSLDTTCYAAILLAALLFCSLARRTGAWLKWALVACAVCALQGLFFYHTLRAHEFSIGYNLHPDWGCFSLPWLAALTVCLRQCQAMRSLKPLPGDAPTWRATKARARLANRNANFPRPAWLTPTSVVAALVLAALASLFLWIRADLQRQAQKKIGLIKRVWPRECAATRERLAARQSVKETLNETTVDLSQRANAALTDSINPAPGAKDDGLEELPAGNHIFGGVPFNVQGRIQLLGGRLMDSPKRYPVQVKDIPIGRRCENIYLLHGAAFVSADSGPVKVARLILHYADGSRAGIDIKAGEHVLDWRGPLYQTGERPNIMAPGTELAWAGSNPRIKKEQPGKSLRLYKSTFANPHPELEITSLDYASAVTDAAPFMVGLTVE